MEQFYYALSSVLDPDPDSNPHKYATDVEGGACSLQSTHGCNSNWTRASGLPLEGAGSMCPGLTGLPSSGRGGGVK